MTRFKLYVGCALTHASADFRDTVERLKKKLGLKYEVLSFFGLGEGTEEDVYQRDIIECVDRCDVMLAICDEPSTGLGLELCEAVKVRGIPVLAVARGTHRITRIVRGMRKFHPNLRIESYVNLLEDIPELLDKFVAGAEGDIWDHELGGPRWAFKPVYMDRERKI